MFYITRTKNYYIILGTWIVVSFFAWGWSLLRGWSLACSTAPIKNSKYLIIVTLESIKRRKRKKMWIDPITIILRLSVSSYLRDIIKYNYYHTIKIQSRNGLRCDAFRTDFFLPRPSLYFVFLSSLFFSFDLILGILSNAMVQSCLLYYVLCYHWKKFDKKVFSTSILSTFWL